MLMERSADLLEEDDFRVLITAQEAYPAMEEAFLDAKSEIWASYRVFDLATKLRSQAGKRIGETWFDLIVHTLRRGVDVNMVLSDFDPILAPDLHRMTWSSKRAFIAAAEMAGPDARLSVVAATHCARVGLLPRILLWPRLVKELGRHADALNDADPQTRARMWETSPGLQDWLVQDRKGRLRAKRWPPPPLVPGTHHQKIVVFDRKLLCIGGLDLDERRYDDKGHHRRRDETWHDVQVMCEGPVASEAQTYLEGFLHAVAGDPPPTLEGRLLTTLSRPPRGVVAALGPRPVQSSIWDAHRDCIARAERLIYLETQFFRDIHIAQALAKAARANPDLSLILIVPAAPEDVAFNHSTGSDARFGEYQQARAVGIVQEAFGPRAAICSPVRAKSMSSEKRDVLCGSPIIYVHAKVSIFDADRAIVSSANLNGRSLYWDTEAGVMIDGPDNVASLRERTFRHWQGGTAAPEFLDPATACSAWRARAERNADVSPADRTGFLVPYDAAPARRFGRRLWGIPDAIV